MVIADGSNGVTVRFGLPKTESQQQFSLAFVRLVAAAAGFWIKSHETDYDGVDITIVSSADYEMWSCPSLELQVKCTTRAELLKDDHLLWRIESKSYSKLIKPRRFEPTYLGVLLVPPEVDAWLDHNEDRLLTRSRMYFESAVNLPMSSPGRRSTAVRLPRRNLFDVSALQAIMKHIGDGGDRCGRAESSGLS